MSAGTALIGAQATQQVAGGFAGNNQARAEANAYDQNARLTELQGEFDVLSALRKSRMEDGAMITDAAAGGGGGGAGVGGSMADILYANSVQRQMEALNIRHSAGAEATGLRARASNARADGRAAIVNGVMRAGAAVISGVESKRMRDKLDAQWERERRDGRTLQPIGTIPVPRLPYDMRGF